jgi:hypothetical protein
MATAPMTDPSSDDRRSSRLVSKDSAGLTVEMENSSARLPRFLAVNLIGIRDPGGNEPSSISAGTTRKPLQVGQVEEVHQFKHALHHHADGPKQTGQFEKAAASSYPHDRQRATISSIGKPFDHPSELLPLTHPCRPYRCRLRGEVHRHQVRQQEDHRVPVRTRSIPSPVRHPVLPPPACPQQGE